MTPNTEKLFKELADDAGNWSGTPLLDITAAQRGNLTDLKKLGLITTFKSDGWDFVDFTDAGKALAAEMGFKIP